MPIRAIVFDIGGVLEVTPSGVEPTVAFPAMIARWEERLHLRPGELDARLRRLDERLKRMGKDGALGTYSEAEWVTEPRLATEMDAAQPAERYVCQRLRRDGRHSHPAGIAHVW